MSNQDKPPKAAPANDASDAAEDAAELDDGTEDLTEAGRDVGSE